ncbi:MAG: hypothetical protein WBW62_07385, partial [Solirubrobacterales bacterium]
QVGEERERIWRLYMTASIGAFERGVVSIHQIVAVIPDADHEIPLARQSYVRSESDLKAEMDPLLK